jgi:hypothetical protein
MISDVKPKVRLATSEVEIDCRQCSIRRSSLKAGMIIERCMGKWIPVYGVETCMQ